MITMTKFFRTATLIALFFLVLALVIGVSTLTKHEGSQASAPEEASKSVHELPDISVFQTQPSDRFLVDFDDITSGHPFKGVNSIEPHAGAHVHFDNSANRWPKDSPAPAGFPPIYAVADGIVSRVDFRYGQGTGNDRYGLDLAFALDRSRGTCQFCYSIEPMIAEP
jgi:murein DD-endopeptidase MepM/ murein hydrolase activator NlpD